ncbi:MAG: hypothetical protein HY851_10010, partial [candidate division Zixibacteria bacterium]|nr:hypothetical protein [candidate division Zixibacteria bacterium]
TQKLDNMGNVVFRQIESRPPATYEYEYTYNQLEKSTDPLGHTSRNFHDGFGNLKQSIAPTGETTTNDYFLDNTYPVKGLLKSTSVGSHTNAPLVTTFAYDPNTANTTLVDPPGNLAETTTVYDNYSVGGVGRGVGLPISVTVWNSRVTASLYDFKNNRLKGTVDPMGQTTCFAYDIAGRRTRVFAPNAVPVSMMPMPGPSPTNGNECGTFYATLPDADSPTATSFYYDVIGRQVKMIKPAVGGKQPLETAEYNLNGEMMKSSFYMRGAVSPSDRSHISYAYDAAGRLKEKTAPVDPARLSNPPPQGAPPAVEKTRFNYDALGRVTGVANDAAALYYTYDVAGNALTAETGPGLTGNYPIPFTRNTYAYDNGNNRVSMAPFLASGLTPRVRYAYDPSNRLVSLSEYGLGLELDNRFPDALFKFQYDPLGRRLSVDGRAVDLIPVNYSGATEMDEMFLKRRTEYAYNAEGLLKGIFDYDKSNGSGVQSFEYGDVEAGCFMGGAACSGYDPAGRRRWMKARDYSVNYGYDKVDRLTAANYTDTATDGYPAPNETYNYDTNGNRTEKNGAQTKVDNLRNQIESNLEWTFAFDLNGNMIEKNHKTTGEKVEYTYNAENQLMRVRSVTGPTLNYTAGYIYDPLGRRILYDITNYKETDLAKKRKCLFFAYDGDDVIAEYACNYDTNGGIADYSLSSHYLHGPGVDEPLVWWTKLTSSDTTMHPHLYYFDGLGSVTAITGFKDGVTWTDPNAERPADIMATYIYDSFGNQVKLCGELATLNRYRYTAREWDDFGSTATEMKGLNYHRARYADLKLGIFLQEDPKWGANLFLYADNNPSSFSDPNGTAPREIGGGLFTGLVFLAQYLYDDWFSSRPINSYENSQILFAGGILRFAGLEDYANLITRTTFRVDPGLEEYARSSYNNIILSPGFFSLTGSEQSFVMVHELKHLMQGKTFRSNIFGGEVNAYRAQIQLIPVLFSKKALTKDNTLVKDVLLEYRDLIKGVDKYLRPYLYMIIDDPTYKEY